MPLISPESSSSSSREGEVLIMSSSGTIYHHNSLDNQAVPFETVPEPWTDTSKDRIIVLGPFAPTSIDLTPSESDMSALSHWRGSKYSPIPVPIPTYEDCFQAPLFDPMEYEADAFDVESREMEWLGGYCDHLETVKSRIEVEDALMSLDRPITPVRPIRAEKLEASPAARPRSPPSMNHQGGEASEDVFLDSAPPKPRRASKLNPEAPAYTIPQLRSLAIIDDLPADPDPDSLCHACHDLCQPNSMKRVLPCHDVICRRCFSAALGAVSEGHPVSRCPACLRPMTAFAKLDHRTKQHLAETIPGRSSERELAISDGPVVMRIDNVAWDLTPDVVEAFLPPQTLAGTPVPIHIPLDRFDGRTKDYMYIEVASMEAARRILQKCQNGQMPGGPLTQGRKRAVTITQVHHTELLRELRPHSSSELRALLTLCQASVSDVHSSTEYGDPCVAPNGIAHFVKTRHGPFNALMSILSKVRGKESPTYWDLFYVTSGAIAALASHIARTIDPAIEQQEPDLDPDRAILKKLTGMFENVFGLKLDSGRMSPV